MSSDMTIADYLRASVDELLTYGWKQLDQGYPDEAKCTTGAIRFVTDADEANPERYNHKAKEVETWIDRHYPEVANSRFGCGDTECYGIAAWNDQPGRTLDDVVEMLLVAADDWEADHASP